MGYLKDEQSGVRYFLGTEQELGRAKRCVIQVSDAAVSALHASIRWQEGEGWQLKDLGSRNGTYLDGEHLKDNEWHLLKAGSVIALGSAQLRWILEEASAPRPVIVPADGGTAIVIEGETLALPSEANPNATIFRGRHGAWQLELPNSVVLLTDQDTFELDGRSFRFVAGDARTTTPTSQVAVPIDFDQCQFSLSVSSDEEEVAVTMKVVGREQSLGVRACYDLLLLLARLKAEDRAQGLPEASCGWTYHDEIVDKLKTTYNQLNVDIFRLRQYFGGLGVQGASQVVERRLRSGQLRTGMTQFSIEKA